PPSLHDALPISGGGLPVAESAFGRRHLRPAAEGARPDPGDPRRWRRSGPGERRTLARQRNSRSEVRLRCVTQPCTSGTRARLAGLQGRRAAVHHGLAARSSAASAVAQPALAAPVFLGSSGAVDLAVQGSTTLQAG